MTRRLFPFSLACALVLTAAAARADNVWNGSINGDWFVAGNWSAGHAPLAAENVVIGSAGNDPVLTNQTAALNSFTIANKTLSCSNWFTKIRATTISIQNGGILTLVGAGTNDNNLSRIYLQCTDCTIDPGGGIDVNYRGYAGTGPGAPGATVWHGAGAGHGGRGGVSSSASSIPGPTNDAPDAPVFAGSSGLISPPYPAGVGGGAVRIDALGTVTVNGLISANATNTTLIVYGIGAGAGGSIYITCNTFAGSTNGLLSAKGGSTDMSQAGGGGGGRIAVHYANLGTPHAARFDCSAGNSYAGANTLENSRYASEMGTLWLPDAQLLTPTMTDQLFTYCNLLIDDFASWSPDNLTVRNCSFQIDTPGFALTATNGILIDNGGLGIHGNITTLHGDLVLTNAGKLWVFGAATNDVTPDYGGLVCITGNVAVGNASWIYPYCERFSGGGVLFRMSNLTAAAGGGFDADGRGYGPTNGPGLGSDNGGGHGSGAGYGGRGGPSFAYTTYGDAYGSPDVPIQPGSGTGGRGVGGEPGGGLIRLEAGNAVIVNGTLSANGGKGWADAEGCGSGGGILITCTTFGGSSAGLLRANAGPTRGYGGGGGGGRVAIHYTSLDPIHSLRFTCSPNGGVYGLPVDDVNSVLYPRKGTLWLSDPGLLSVNLGNNQFQDVRLIIPGFTSWSPDSLTISNWDAVIEIPDFRLTVTNGIRIDSGGKLGIWGTLATRNGDLVLTNGGILRVYAAPTNSSPDYGALVSVTGNVVIGAGSWLVPVCDPTNGGAPLLRAVNITVATNAGFNADLRGFVQGYGPGYPGNLFNGPGGGHGGKGGTSSSYPTTYGALYDSTNAPRIPGSSGGDATRSGAGGGVIRVDASGDISFDGTLSANGGATKDAGNAGGGAGGSVFLFANSLSCNSTAAVMRANGGPGALAGGGGGGGGRISVGVGLSVASKQQIVAETPPALTVYQNPSEFEGALQVESGIGWSNGWVGTKQFMAPYTWLLTIAGRPDNYDRPHPNKYGQVGTIPMSAWVTNTVTSPAEELNGMRRACLGWELADAGGTVDNGTGTQVTFHLTEDLWLYWNWTNQYQLTVTPGPNGTVNSGIVDGWYTNGLVQTNVLATPDNGYNFYLWSGLNVPAGHEMDNPLVVTMTVARTLQANFVDASVQTRYWTGTGTWDSPTNWSPNGMPAPYDHAVVQSGLLILNVARSVASLSVNNGATLMFTNWSTKLTVAEDVIVRSGGTVGLPPAFANEAMSNRVYIACADFTVEAGGKIDADAKGYICCAGPGAGSGGWHSSGGSYGGKGGLANNGGAFFGATYGSASDPVGPGSGGGGSLYGTTAYNGYGGGAVRIDATDTVIVDGTITANGGDTGSYGYGGGSGGGISISCATFGGQGTGLISANGGNPANGGWHSGGGGGGRIAVHYSNLASSHAVRFSAARATGGWADANRHTIGRWPWASDNGTLWLTDASLLSENMKDALFQGVDLVIPGLTNWAVNNLTISNCWFRPATDGMRIVVTNDLVIDGGGLDLGSTNGNSTLTVGGDLVLTNGGSLSIFSGTNLAGGYGALVDVAGDIVLGPNSWIYPYCHPTNGGSVLIRGRNLAVATNGGINATGKGFGSFLGPGAPAASTWHSSAASYGGRGGPGENYPTTFGPIYGPTNAAVYPGSGGGGNDASYPYLGGGYGGGLVRMELSGLATVDGSVIANGGISTRYGYAGGSGGGIFIACQDAFSGGTAAVLQVSGGTPDSDFHSGSGGGGRIAVWYQVPGATRPRMLTDPDNPLIVRGLLVSNSCEEYLGTLNANGGIGGWSNGMPGTIRFLTIIADKGAILTIW